MLRPLAPLAALSLAATVFAATIFAAPAFADGHSVGDAKKGSKTFGKCKSCHMIVSDDGEVITKGGKSGPNLYGVVGRVAGTAEGFKYSKDLILAGDAGLVWDEASLAEWSMDPKAFLKAYLDKSKAKSKMSFKLKKGGDDVAAYLASVGPVVAEETETPAETSEETTTSTDG